MWNGPFLQLSNSQVEALFADHRTYKYGGKVIDHQDHVGFDLSVVQHYPIEATNDGTILFADFLGIYGNCVLIDHGYGLVSLYGHLSSIDVKQGQSVKKKQVIGKSGETGLAGGDHLHFGLFRWCSCESYRMVGFALDRRSYLSKVETRTNRNKVSAQF